MKYIVAATLLPFVLALPSRKEETRALSARMCNIQDATCADITRTCTSEAENVGKTALINPWSKKSCVASVACLGGLDIFAAHFNCAGRTVPAGASAPHLDYQVYANIVGDCAWKAGGCPITPQNFVDLIYSSATSNWPESPEFVIKNWWTPIVQWAFPSATDPSQTSIPYTNFDDYLRFFGNVDPPPITEILPITTRSDPPPITELLPITTRSDPPPITELLPITTRVDPPPITELLPEKSNPQPTAPVAIPRRDIAGQQA